MNILLRITIVLFLMAALLPAPPAAAAPAVELLPDPTCLALGSALNALAFTDVVGGSVVCVLVPGAWNGDLVIFAHGYVAPTAALAIPWDQMISGAGGNLPALVTSLGYAFATTSYSKTGLAIKPALDDLLNLVAYSKGLAAQQGAAIGRVYITGASEGGLITTLALEQHPEIFAAGFSTCGPVGSFQAQVQYWGDFRVAFDQKFPANPLVQYGATPIYIPPQILENWEVILATAGAGMDPALALQLLQEQHVPYDPAVPESVMGSISELLWYNAFATNDGRKTLVSGLNDADLLPPSLLGNPYSNPAYRSGYPMGIRTDRAAIKEIQRYYTTSALLKRPLVLMHTTGDPVVPFSQSTTYLAKALKTGSLARIAYIPVERYGHCAFQPAEILFGFYVMVLRATLSPFNAAQIEAALPAPADRAQFTQLKMKHKDQLR